MALLTIGYLGSIQQRDEAAGEVLLRLIQQAPGEPGAAVVLAGEAVLDTWPGGGTLRCRGVYGRMVTFYHHSPPTSD